MFSGCSVKMQNYSSITKENYLISGENVSSQCISPIHMNMRVGNLHSKFEFCSYETQKLYVDVDLRPTPK